MKLKVHEHNKNNLKIVSKTKILLLLLMTCSMGFGQPGTRIQFTYDAAGNQIKRVICIGCNARMANPETLKDEKTVTDADRIVSDIEKISYYPNPVREELYVKWENQSDNFVSQIEIYSITGQLLKSYENLKGLDTSTVSFQPYPEGYYNLILTYTNGESKTLKIVKQK